MPAQRDRHERRAGDRALAARRRARPALHRAPRVHARRARRRDRAQRARSSRAIVARGIEASPIGQVLLDQSVIGWGEFELEVMRDGADNVVIVCSIENVDPMGVHTGDSVTVAPQQTLTDRLYQRLRDQAIAVIRAVGVETGGSNVQFAVNPDTEEILVIEMNPRVSRSSALASKATGFPIAKIAARLAVGYLLEEIDNDITGVTPGLLRADDRLRGRQVAALRLREVPRRGLAAVDAHEVRRRGDGDRAHVRAGLRQGAALARARQAAALAAVADQELLDGLATPAARSLRGGAGAAAPRARRSQRCTSARAIDPWFLHELQALARDPQGPFAGQALVLARSTPAPRSSPRARPTTTRAGSARRTGAHEVARGERALGRDPRRGPQPDRPGNRVRLLLRARRDDRARARQGRGDDQLQPRDRVDRLRHVRPPVFRAADARGCARRCRGRAPAGGRRAVRRADAAEARRRAGCRRACRCSGRASRRSTSPRTAGASARC